ncbi:hypothetical protein EGW08_011204 [Elysia chlorotica]|uniref:Uncharacterized protein n=1 Tax=Elysia chlorotica TaxID=188477 RepID=A0A3S0ZMA1_ELYCH|nr:hypothetical protein EGW08_011204 [Elysia chlorotica]
MRIEELPRCNECTKSDHSRNRKLPKIVDRKGLCPGQWPSYPNEWGIGSSFHHGVHPHPILPHRLLRNMTSRNFLVRGVVSQKGYFTFLEDVCQYSRAQIL